MSIDRRRFFGFLGAAAATPILARAIDLEQRADGRIITLAPQPIITAEAASATGYLTIPISAVRSMSTNYFARKSIPISNFDSVSLAEYMPGIMQMDLSINVTPELAQSVYLEFQAYTRAIPQIDNALS